MMTCRHCILAGGQAPPKAAASSRKALAEQHRSTDKLRATISHLEAMAQRQAKDAVLAPQVRPWGSGAVSCHTDWLFAIRALQVRNTSCA